LLDVSDCLCPLGWRMVIVPLRDGLLTPTLPGLRESRNSRKDENAVFVKEKYTAYRKHKM
jgi:hypothetical protein